MTALASSSQVMVAENAVREIVLRLHATLEDQMDEAHEMVAAALDESRWDTKCNSEAMFGKLRRAMSKVVCPPR